MGPVWLWASLLPVCVATAWLAVRRPLRSVWEERDTCRARLMFRRHRERLELCFLEALSREQPHLRPRWDDARWQGDVVWARDRHTRHLLALVGVDFDPDHLPFADETPRRSTVMFEYRDGRWHADGRHLDELLPGEALLRHRQLEPLERF